MGVLEICNQDAKLCYCEVKQILNVVTPGLIKCTAIGREIREIEFWSLQLWNLYILSRTTITCFSAQVV